MRDDKPLSESNLPLAAASVPALRTPGHSKQEILRRRAMDLARPPESEDAAGSTLDIVEFVLAHERYAIEAGHVNEVAPLRDLTPIPCVPPFVTGVINLRGRIVSVIDIKKFFDLPDKGIADLHDVIVVGHAALELGVLADAVASVRTVRLSDVQSSLPTLTGLRADYLRGITRDGVVILDVIKILSDPRILVREEVET